jgi:hypothetical protein
MPPQASYYQNNPEMLIAASSVQSVDAMGICTIGHPIAGAACVGAVEIVRLVLDGAPPRI